MWVFFVLIILSAILIIISDSREFGFALGLLILIVTPFIFVSDYFYVIELERDIEIKYKNLIQEGDVIETFSNDILIKTSNTISLENNNQASSYIGTKSKWMEEVKEHNILITKHKWRHEQNGFLIYMCYGLLVFKSEGEAEKYFIEIR